MSPAGFGMGIFEQQLVQVGRVRRHGLAGGSMLPGIGMRGKALSYYQVALCLCVQMRIRALRSCSCSQARHLQLCLPTIMDSCPSAMGTRNIIFHKSLLVTLFYPSNREVPTNTVSHYAPPPSRFPTASCIQIAQ